MFFNAFNPVFYRRGLLGRCYNPRLKKLRGARSPGARLVVATGSLFAPWNNYDIVEEIPGDVPVVFVA